MKFTIRILITVGLLAAALFAVHGAFLVAHDIEGQNSPKQITPAAPVAKPSPATEKPAPTPEDIRAIANERIEPPPAPREPERKEATFNVLPGRAFNLSNRHFRKVLIRAEYPVRVYSGDCHNDYTVQWVCDGDPADLFVTDTRQMPVFLTPRSNAVTVTMIEF